MHTKFTEGDTKFNRSMTAEVVEERLKEKRKNLKKLMRKASTIDEKQFSVYEPLVKNLRLDSNLAMFSNLFINFRRLTMLYMAMFIRDMAWV